MRASFYQFEILILKALIAIKPWGSTILAVVAVFAILGAIVAGLAVAIPAAVTLVAAVIVGSVVAIVAGLVMVTNKFVELGAYLKSINLADVGMQMMIGLANGITGAAGAVFNAIKGTVTGAIDGAKKLLMIKSPSQVFAEIGMQTGAGMVEGVDASAADVQGSMASMVAPPDALETVGSTSSASSVSSAPSAGASVTGNTFILNGVQGAEDAETRIRAIFTQIMEGNAAQLGTQVPT